MKSENLMTLALRVVAVIIAAYACADISNIAAFLLVGQKWMSAQPTALSVLGRDAAFIWSIPVIVAVLLWYLAPRIARFACRGMSRDVGFQGLDINQLTHAAFVVMGLGIFLSGFWNLIRLCIDVLPLGASGVEFPWNYGIEYVLRSLFGFVLIVGGRGLSRMLLRLRTAGTEQS